MLSHFKGPAMNIIRNVASEFGKDLKIGHVIEKVEKMDEKLMAELKNSQLRRQQKLSRADWRESVTSLKPQDTFYKVSVYFCFFLIRQKE